MKRKIFTLVLSVFICSMAMSQGKTGVIKKASVAPVIDGIIDAVWAEANVYNIAVPFKTETPTLGTVGQTTWQALWTEAGIYILVKVKDDVWMPSYAGTDTAASWNYDKIEIYFDVNAVKQDGGGASGGKGHYQFAPVPRKDRISGGTFINKGANGANGATWSLKVSNPAYLMELFIPFEKLLDQDGAPVDMFGDIGFDITIADNDVVAPMRNRMNWSNAGAKNEAWINMDDAGIITLDSPLAPVYIDRLTIANGSINTDKGTLQLNPVIEPANATNKILKWTIEGGTGSAKISSTGLLSAVSNGTVIVKASATDPYLAIATATITISGQKTIVYSNDVWNSLNLIKNWNFDTDMTSWGGWIDGSIAGQVSPIVQGGVCQMKVSLPSDGASWHYSITQSDLTGKPNIPYTLRFKSWSSVNSPCNVVFQDTQNLGANRYGATSDPESKSGRSDWNYNITTTPNWYTFHVIFDQLKPTSVQKIMWQLSLSNSTIYLDSVLLVKNDELLLSSNALSVNENSMSVYPNPIGAENELNVSLTTINTKVFIYNALGQKMMEKVANGNIAKFDVSSLRKGMYFVRLSDGTTRKFIK